MKRLHIFIFSSLVSLLWGNGFSVYAQPLPSQGTWKATTISSNLTVVLTGDITIEGCITINSGKTLKIVNNSDTSYLLSVDEKFPNGTNIFNNGGTLEISGKETGRITIDGGAEFEYSEDGNYKPVSLTAGTKKRIQAGIHNTGKLSLNYVTIQNVNDYNSYGGAISTSTSKTVEISNCTITKCYSQLGSAIMISGGSGAVSIKQSEISKCFSGGGSTERAGGAIRTYGAVSSSLYLTGVTFRHNYAQRTQTYNNTWDRDGNGGAIFWNARGKTTTECVMDGCLFELNRCDDNGGAIKTQGSIRFTGDTTIIQNNTAPNGAGIYIEGYIGSSGVGDARTITYDLNEKLLVKNNISPDYFVESVNKTYSGKGAGIHFFFGSSMTLEANSIINVNMNGAVVENNNALGDESLGGGVYFENTSPDKMNYTFNIKLNHGAITTNSADKGGGIYVFQENVRSDVTEGYSLIVDKNVATTAGGGVYIDKGDFTIKSGKIEQNIVSNGNGGGVYIIGEKQGETRVGNFTMENGEISSNTGLDGGGIYITGGNFTMANGSITGNGKKIKDDSTYDIVSQQGGGVYIVGGGSFAMNDGSIIQNAAQTAGGGVYIDKGDFTIKSGKIEQNIVSNGNGGGVYIIGEKQGETRVGNFIMENGEISSNEGGNGAGVFLNGGNFDLIQGHISKNPASQYGGGVYLIGDNCEYLLKNGTISNNRAQHGGGVYLADGSFKLTESEDQTGKISENVADTAGGGVYIAGAGGFEMNGGSVYKNETTAEDSNGGGVFLNGGDFTMNAGNIEGNESKRQGGGVLMYGGAFTMTGGQINGNTTTTNGGGVCIIGVQTDNTMSGSFTMQNGNPQIKENKGDNGGGVYIYGGNFTMTSGSITSNGQRTSGQNVESRGGGVYIKGIKLGEATYGNFTMSNGTIENNSSNDGGGVYIDGGSLNVTSGNIFDNTANANGGGVYILNGTVNMGEAGKGGRIQQNECYRYGGGVYVYNSDTISENPVEVNLEGGTVEGNDAKYGGGICVDGNISLNIGNIEIASNEAINGGGVCLMNNAQMTFSEGQIKNNNAISDSDEIYITGYKKNIDEIKGFGGGVYLSANTRLVFDNTAEKLGLFGNIADNGGDEVFANGDGTYVNLPDVSHMALDGYAGASNLRWIEDYTNNDIHYDKGTHLKGLDNWSKEQTTLRYREAIRLNGTIYNLPSGSNVVLEDTYVSFALGYEVAYLTITRTGLRLGESAIYELYKNDENNFRIIITGDGTDSVTKKIAVTAGEWIVREMPWSWTYDVTDNSIATDASTDANTTDRAVVHQVPYKDPQTGKEWVFVFNGTRQEISSPMNKEDIDVKIMAN